jgi:hypothetical protein
MPTQSIPISQLDPISQISSSDLLATVQSSSLTTYKTSWGVVGNWISQSVQASSSLQTVSASYALTSSLNTTSSFAIIANNLNFPNNTTSSFAVSSSFAFTAVNSANAAFATAARSASFASQSAFNVSSSWASQSIWATTASFASQSAFNVSSSWASASISSSYSVSSSNATQAAIATTASFASVSPYGRAVYLNTPVVVAYTGPTASAADFFTSTFIGQSFPNYNFNFAYYNSNTTFSPIPYQIFNVTRSLGIPNVPSSILVLGTHSDQQNGGGIGYVYMAQNTSSALLLLMTGGQAGSGAGISSMAGTYPVNNDGTIAWKRIGSNLASGWGIAIIGYFN